MTESGSPPPHALPVAAVLARLEANVDGLSRVDAAARLERYGPNRLPAARPPTFRAILLRQFQSPLIYILALAGAVSLLVGEVVDAGFIFAVLALNASIGSLQEWKAEKSSQALQNLLRIGASVVRDGEVRDVDGEEVVPGDVLWLESGNRVPADARLLMAQGLAIDESLLTGESVPVGKEAEWVGKADASAADRLNMVHAGSIVARGRARAVVVATGSQTLVGQLARAVTGQPIGKAPLLVRLERFTRTIGIAFLVAVLLVGVIGSTWLGHSVTDMFLFAVALAVSAIPEGLPVALTIALAVATARMARRGVIVRRLTAVEGLGSCTLVATDKTGTLTCNELTVRRVVLADGTALEVTGEGYAPTGHVLLDGAPVLPGERPELDALARALVLVNEASLHAHDEEWTWRGDPTDVALLSFARKLGWNRETALGRFPRLNEIPFEPEHKYAAAWHRGDDGTRVFVKGAPERVLEMCQPSAATGEVGGNPLELAHGLAEQGFRVLAVAEGPGAPVEPDASPSEPSGLRFLGFVGMIDPLRPGVRDAVLAAKEAGVAVTMVTGDHPVTALAIARELGLAADPAEVRTGRDLPGLDEKSLAPLVDRVRVFARVSPEEKLAIVRAARAGGHFVAVTGDGVNDAPALRAANIGVAMGRGGTDVARESADLVLTDDNFATIVNGIEEGRVAYDNVRKVIHLLVSTGAGEVVLVFLCLAAGLPLALLPAQLLWLNLVTNGIQHVGLAFEPREDDVLRRPPRPPREPVFNRLMLERVLVGAVVIGAVGFVAFRWMIAAGWEEPAARNALLLLLVLFENVHVGNSRSETVSIFRLSPLRSPLLLAGTIAAFLVHVAAMYFPVTRAVLGTEPVGLEVWAGMVGLALTLAVAMELHKLSWRLRYTAPTHERTEDR